MKNLFEGYFDFFIFHLNCAGHQIKNIQWLNNHLPFSIKQRFKTLIKLLFIFYLITNIQLCNILQTNTLLVISPSLSLSPLLLSVSLVFPLPSCNLLLDIQTLPRVYFFDSYAAMQTNGSDSSRFCLLVFYLTSPAVTNSPSCVRTVCPLESPHS